MSVKSARCDYCLFIFKIPLQDAIQEEESDKKLTQYVVPKSPNLSPYVIHIWINLKFGYLAENPFLFRSEINSHLDLINTNLYNIQEKLNCIDPMQLDYSLIQEVTAFALWLVIPVWIKWYSIYSVSSALQYFSWYHAHGRCKFSSELKDFKTFLLENFCSNIFLALLQITSAADNDSNLIEGTSKIMVIKSWLKHKIHFFFFFISGHELVQYTGLSNSPNGNESEDLENELRQLTKYLWMSRVTVVWIFQFIYVCMMSDN